MFVMRSTLLFLGATVGAVSAASVKLSGAAGKNDTVKIPAPELPEEMDWALSREGAFDGDTEKSMLKLTFVVKQSNFDKLPDLVKKVSDPASADYGKYLSKEEVDDLTAPSKEDLDAVRQWLDDKGVKATLKGSNVFEAHLSVASAEDLLKTRFATVHSEAQTTSTHRAGGIEIPTDVNASLAGITGLYDLPLPRPVRNATEAGHKLPSTSRNGQSFSLVTPTVIREVYSVPGEARGDQGNSNSQAIAEFGIQLNLDNLQTYFEEFVPFAEPGDVDLVTFHGDPGATTTGRPAKAEANADIQFIMGVAPGVRTQVYYYSAPSFCQGLKQWTTDLLALASPPLVNSISYGFQGHLATIGCTRGLVSDLDGDFAKLASRGISLLFASGDSGSGYKRSRLPPFARLFPSWPASSPFVTAVGATTFLNNRQSGVDTERSANLFGSGGGFYHLFAQPSYQTSFTRHYLSNNRRVLPPSFLFNPNTRATPDVSALGQNVADVDVGGVFSFSGTSAATPITAALISLINQELIVAGRPPLGFLNFFLYAHPQAFTDITIGTNKHTFNGPLPIGWSTAVGWDPVSGLGTPIFPGLQQAAKVPLGLRQAAASVGSEVQEEAVAPPEKAAVRRHEFDDAELVDVGSFIQMPGSRGPSSTKDDRAGASEL